MAAGRVVEVPILAGSADISLPRSARALDRQVQVDCFYAYGGSLATPGRIESVRWSVLSDGRHVSQMAVNPVVIPHPRTVPPADQRGSV